VRHKLHNCLLRAWRAGDEASLTSHANSRDIWLNLRDQFPHPYTPEDAEAWVKFASSQAQPTSLAIEVDSEAVGGISLKLHDDVERVSAEIGYWLGQRFWSRGIMTAAVRAVTEYGFEQFSLTRVYALPFVTNVASHRVLEKAGYAREGLLRRSAIKDGIVLDQVVFAITDHDLARASVGSVPSAELRR
jgi:ribosomal-protein-alanine N-acetyltransferase